jgi:hypothetical protein
VLRILGPLLASLAIAAVACGDDDGGGVNDGGGEFPEGAAADVEGVWDGTYQSGSSGRFGAFCLELDQDGRELNGTVHFQGEQPLAVGGIISNDRMAWTWAPATGSATPAASLAFASGGTFSGDVSLGGDTVSGTWTSLTADSGTWAGERLDSGSCE